MADDLNRQTISSSPEATWQLAGSLMSSLLDSNSLDKPLTIALHGELGSGKTCFVQGIAVALGIEEPVTSPTFTLVNEYHGLTHLCHIDLYRISGPDEALALGIEEHLEAPGVIAIEWPERAGALLPHDAVHVSFSTMDDQDSRTIRITTSVE